MSDSIDLITMIRKARKAPEEVAALTAVRREEVVIPIMKPLKNGVYWRVRPEEEWHFSRHSLLLLQSDRDTARSDFMLISSNIAEFVHSKVQIRSAVRTFGLALAVNTFGSPAFWALNLNDPGAWGTSAREIAERLTGSWGMVIPDEGRYSMAVPEGDLGAPKWPDGSPDELLKIAFEGRFIASEDHPVFQKLLGKC